MNNTRMYWAAGIIAVTLLLLAAIVPMIRHPEKRPLTMPRATKLSPELKQYKTEPTISFYSHKTGMIQNLKLEQYLEGVLAAEVGSKMPLEALKAQAIAARSLVMNRIKYGGGVRKLHNTDACDLPEHFQAYDASLVTDKIRSAVKSTRGQVITSNGRFAYALFHSYSWKKTADITEYFPELKAMTGSYIKSVYSPGENYAPPNEVNWKAVIPKSELRPLFGSANLDDLKVSRRGPSGRALELTAGGKTVKAYDLRTAVGGERLKSTMITSIKPDNGNIVFTGHGWGHGCGMSQWGAFAMAKQGKTAAQIINHYYPNTEVVKLWK